MSPEVGEVQGVVGARRKGLLRFEKLQFPATYDFNPRTKGWIGEGEREKLPQKLVLIKEPVFLVPCSLMLKSELQFKDFCRK